MEDPMVAPAPAKTRPTHKQPAQKQSAHKQRVDTPLLNKSVAKPEPGKRERCARCGVAISSRRTPCVWHEHIVCAHCHGRLRAYEPAMAFCPGAKPVLPYARGAQNAPAHGLSRWMTSMGRKLVSIF